MYTYASTRNPTRKCCTVSFLHVTTRKFLWPVCNGWPLIGRLTHSCIHPRETKNIYHNPARENFFLSVVGNGPCAVGDDDHKL